MFDERVLHPRKFTVHDQERKSTDVCCTIIGAIFALVMFIVACTMWNKGNSTLTQIDSKTIFSNSTPQAMGMPVIKDMYTPQTPTISQ